MARVDLPQSRLRARRRRRRALVGACALLILLALLGGLVWLSRAPFLRITAVAVSGAQTVATSRLDADVREQISGAYLGLFPRDNIFLYPRQRISKLLLNTYPSFSRVDVHAADFHTVAVEVAEREPVALWCPSAGSGQVPSAGGEACSYLDENGLAYAPAPQFSEAPYVFYQGALATTSSPALMQYLTPGEFQSLRALVEALMQKEPDDPIGTVAVDSNLDVRAYFHDDFLLMFSLKDDGGDVFERFSLALIADPFKGKTLSDFEYLDLRFGNKLYYKAK